MNQEPPYYNLQRRHRPRWAGILLAFLDNWSMAAAVAVELRVVFNWAHRRGHHLPNIWFYNPGRKTAAP